MRTEHEVLNFPQLVAFVPRYRFQPRCGHGALAPFLIPAMGCQPVDPSPSHHPVLTSSWQWAALPQVPRCSAHPSPTPNGCTEAMHWLATSVGALERWAFSRLTAVEPRDSLKGWHVLGRATRCCGLPPPQDVWRSRIWCSSTFLFNTAGSVPSKD